MAVEDDQVERRAAAQQHEPAVADPPERRHLERHSASQPFSVSTVKRAAFQARLTTTRPRARRRPTLSRRAAVRLWSRDSSPARAFWPVAAATSSSTRGGVERVATTLRGSALDPRAALYEWTEGPAHGPPAERPVRAPLEPGLGDEAVGFRLDLVVGRVGAGDLAEVDGGGGRRAPSWNLRYSAAARLTRQIDLLIGQAGPAVGGHERLVGPSRISTADRVFERRAARRRRSGRPPRGRLEPAAAHGRSGIDLEQQRP